jgi:hypothetical protein
VCHPRVWWLVLGKVGGLVWALCPLAGELEDLRQAYGGGGKQGYKFGAICRAM